MRGWLLLLVLGSGCALVKGPPRDGECRANLRTIMAGEVAFHEATLRYSVHPRDVGFSPPPGNRYLYLFAPEGQLTLRDGRSVVDPAVAVGVGPDSRSRDVTADWLLARFPADVRALLGIHGECPACQVVVGCVGNIDDDEAVDVWTISTEDRSFEGREVVRGTAYRHRNDREVTTLVP